MSQLVQSEGLDRFFEPGAPVGFTENRLPHWHQDGAWIFVTWRLFDSLPQHLLDQLKQEQKEWMARHPRPWSVETARVFEQTFSDKVEAWVNAGYGGCFLRDGLIRGLVERVIRFGDMRLYELGDFVLMPNHLHLLFRPFSQHPLAKAVHAWKGTSAKKINQALGRKGPVWQVDYWDRIIRGPEHLLRVREYIAENPRKAGLREGEFTLGKGGRSGDVFVPEDDLIHPESKFGVN